MVNFLKSPPEGWADEAQRLEGAARSGREVTPVPEDCLSDTVVPIPCDCSGTCLPGGEGRGGWDGRPETLLYVVVIVS